MEFKELGKSGVKIPMLGLGTWGMGGLSSRSDVRDVESVEALRLGLRLGMRFIDTAEMYGDGHSEEVVAKAVQHERESVFIATKVSAEHLSRVEVSNACERSLRRLETSYIDLYQVHWPNPHIPISETMKAMERLLDDGKVRHIGVSNFSAHQIQEAQAALSRAYLASNQVEYSLIDRSIEDELMPYCEREHITVIAYSPLGRGAIPRGKRGGRWRTLDQVASAYGKTGTQVALNWLITKNPVVAIPKASSPHHVVENAGAVGWRMNPEALRTLNQEFK